jgi:hypothetical protein
MNTKWLIRLEESAAKKRKPAQKENKHRTSEQWLQFFEQKGREGFFDAEPDFPRALAELRDAMEEARRSTDPPWDPPEHFMKENTTLHWRLIFWRDWQGRFRKVDKALDWLWNMLERIRKGIPPVGEAEFTMLADWFNANLDRINPLARNEPYHIDLGDGRSRSLWDIKLMIDWGHRHAKANGIDDVRKLKAMLDGKSANGPNAPNVCVPIQSREAFSEKIV